jgi:hypothetical protein
MDYLDAQEALARRRSTAAVVIRAYNNDAIVEQTQRLLDMDVGKVFVTTASDRDGGRTVELLEEAFGDDPRLEVIDLGTAYSWSNALNSSITALRNDEQSFRFMLPISVEVELSQTDLDVLLTAASEERVGAVGVTFAGRYPNGDPVDLGVSYQTPRNTGMLVNLERVGNFVWYDPACDEMGGMEDFDFLVRMRMNTDLRVVMLTLDLPLTVGLHYNQADKEAREREALSKITQRVRSVTPAREHGHLDEVVNELAESWGLTAEDLMIPILTTLEPVPDPESEDLFGGVQLGLLPASSASMAGPGLDLG